MPGTENSESNADNKDAQDQLWDDKKVLMGKGKGDTSTHIVVINLKRFGVVSHDVFSLG